MANDEDWRPKTRQDFIDLYADGIALAKSRHDEAEAKAAAEKGNEGDNDTKPKRSFADFILGI